MIAKVRHGKVYITLDVPNDTFLEHWANAPYMPLPGCVVFFQTQGSAARETLSWEEGHCVGYEEEFEEGSSTTGSYVCHIVIAAPKLTMSPGGPPQPFVAPAPREHGSPAAALAGATEELVTSSGLAGSNAKLVPNTPEHKAVRWQEFQTRNIAKAVPWAYERWSKQYDTNIQNNLHGLKREREYAAELGGVSKMMKTPYTIRQVDLFIEKDGYCGQLKTGKVGLSKQAKIDLLKDESLISELYTVEYILEKGASKPFLAALQRIGASVKIGPQIP